ncbi:MAG: hypothetical protein ACJ75G_02575 [Gaiellaceae bacterium]
MPEPLWASAKASARRAGLFRCRLDLQQVDERRLIPVLERNDLDDAEPLVVSGDDLLARLDMSA